MYLSLRRSAVGLFCLLLSQSSIAAELLSGTVDGKLEIQHRHFFNSPDIAQLDAISGQTSMALNVEYFKEWNNGDDRLEAELFGRLDGADSERTHTDIRQLLWTHYGNNYEFSAGLGRVFWGVTETQHLVDIVNQTDLVENIDGEDKLGQPMLRYQQFTDFGTFEAFLLPYFRERTFEGENGRLGGALNIDTDNPVYQSSSEENHVDWALRYANTFGALDLGLSWFSGTSREPDLFLNFDFNNQSTRPFYPQIDQLGADIQLTLGSWLLKLEAIQRNFDLPMFEDYSAATAGFEYTFVGVFGSQYDLGLLVEYSWDERGETGGAFFQNDATIGGRLTLNDIADSQFLFGISEDFDFSDSKSLFLEGATRINNALSLNVEARYFDAKDPANPAFAIRDSSFVQVGIEYFFD